MPKITETIIVSQSFDASTGQLWNAITDPDEMRQWFFYNIPEFNPEKGFETKFNVSTGERNFCHLWKVSEVISGQKIVYDWRYEGYSGAGEISFEISNLKNSLNLSPLGQTNFKILMINVIRQFVHDNQS